jgi:hypothetical protein
MVIYFSQNGIGASAVFCVQLQKKSGGENTAEKTIAGGNSSLSVTLFMVRAPVI